MDSEPLCEKSEQLLGNQVLFLQGAIYAQFIQQEDLFASKPLA